MPKSKVDKTTSGKRLARVHSRERSKAQVGSSSKAGAVVKRKGKLGRKSPLDHDDSLDPKLKIISKKSLHEIHSKAEVPKASSPQNIDEDADSQIDTKVAISMKKLNPTSSKTSKIHSKVKHVVRKTSTVLRPRSKLSISNEITKAASSYQYSEATTVTDDHTITGQPGLNRHSKSKASTDHVDVVHLPPVAPGVRNVVSIAGPELQYTASKAESRFDRVTKHLPKTKSLLQRPSYYISKYHVPDTEDGYPAPVPPEKSKSEIYMPKYYNVDDYIQQADDSILEDFDDLLEFLLDGATTDVAKVRALYRWVVTVDLPLTTKPGHRSIQTPRGFLYCIRQKQAYFPELFATLCRKAQIPCVIIHGLAKGVCYDAGDKVTHSKGNNSWNAVYIEGSWYFVHPYWGTQTINGYVEGRWAVVECDKFHTGELTPDGKLPRISNDFYFLTDPDKFITRCFPEDPAWQLIHKPLTKHEFEELPFLQPVFYELKLSVQSHHSCIVRTSNGRAEIKLGMPSGKKYKFGYKLYSRRDMESEGEYEVMMLSRYILHYIHDGSAVFDLRFPVVGIFKLELHCNDPSRPLPSDWICDYKIVCAEVMPECEPLTVVPSIGWGAVEELEAVGMECLSHRHPVVSLDDDAVTYIRFTTPKDKIIEIEADMRTIQHSAEELHSNVSLQYEKDYIIVKVSPPGEGEYALQIYMKDATGQRKNVCNFLMHRTFGVEDPELADIRSELSKATESGDVDQLEHWVQKFVDKNMEDRGDLTAARKKLHVAKINRDIREAIDRKDLDLLERTMQSVSDTSLRHQLGELFDKAEALRSKLRRLKRLRHEVLAMDQKTISEMKSYPKPPPAVHAVMAATFLLLGNREIELKKWSKVQALISRQGKESLKTRVANFKIDSVPGPALSRVHEILSKYDLETVQIASAGAATFYQWAMSMTSDVFGDY